MTAKRVALAFAAFFGRVAAGDAPGYPRFKSFSRYPGWGYKTHGDGWRLFERTTFFKKGRVKSHGWRSVRLSGVGTIAMRGRARFGGVPKTAEVIRRAGKWYLSVTFEVVPEAVARTGGAESMAFDWGITTLLTQVIGDPLTGAVETVENPRWLKRQLEKIRRLQQALSPLEEAAKKASGKSGGFPVNAKLARLYAQLRTVHGRLARQRQDFYHQLTARLVARFGLIVTEELNVKGMTAAPAPRPREDGSFAPNGAAAKAGLNRAILDGAPASLIAKLRTKAEEAGSKFIEFPTRKVKPTQRCCECGLTQKLELSERVYRCQCGAARGRDENAPRTMLRYAYEGAWWGPKTRAGTAQAAGQALAGP